MSESLWWKAIKDGEGPKPLTKETLLAGIRKMMEPRPYVPHVHLVSPKEHARGWGICIDCGAMVGDWPEWAQAKAREARDTLSAPEESEGA